MLFYEQSRENFEKARSLVAEQIQEGWSQEEITTYWQSLGYDIFFCQKLINPFFINVK